MALRIRQTKPTTLIVAAFAFFTLGLGGWTLLQQPTIAADLRQFDPGNIMSDAVMSNKDSMTEAQIQAFLNSKNACNNTNTQLAAQYPHLKYNIKNGRFVCMAQERFNGESAARIIWKAGQDYNINPQVLIVLLQKEQGLITDTWPNHVQYRTATGYGCPDTAPCDEQYYGLKNQVRLAAAMFRTVLNGGWSNYPVGNNYVLYNPNHSCGGTNINIKNRATSALYRYTPYQPNKSALNAGYGTGDSCGAYGNRNFWLYFTDWFGSTREINVTALKERRWMKTSKTLKKRNLIDNQEVGEPLDANRQLKFVDKFQINGEWHLRTEYDHNASDYFGIRANDLSEISFKPIDPTWKIVNFDGVHRYVPNIEQWIGVEKGDNLPIGTIVQVNAAATINDAITYRTAYDTSRKLNQGIQAQRLNDLTSITPLDTPRTMRALKNTKMTTLAGSTCKQVRQHDLLSIKGKFIYNGVTYFAEQQTGITPDSLCFIRASELNWHPVLFEAFETPRNMTLTQDVQRINLDTGKVVDRLQRGRTIHFSSKVRFKGEWYYRTTFNTDEKTPFGIPAKFIRDTQ